MKKDAAAWTRPLTTVGGELADMLTSLTFDAWLLATYAVPGGGGLPDGRAWERAITDSLVHPGIWRRQHAGLTNLFGGGSASGFVMNSTGPPTVRPAGWWWRPRRDPTG